MSANAETATITNTEDKNTNNKCHLLELPRELRDMIIEEAIEVKRITPYLGFAVRRNIYQPDLASVNRQLRAETLPVFYKTSPFYFDSLGEPGQWEKVKHWLTANHSYLHMIKVVTFRLCTGHERIFQVESTPGIRTNMRFGPVDPRSVRYYRDSKDATLLQKTRDAARARYRREYSRNQCEFDMTKKVVKKELLVMCESMGVNKFGLEEYVRAVELFWFPEEKRCREDIPEWDSDFDSD